MNKNKNIFFILFFTIVTIVTIVTIWYLKSQQIELKNKTNTFKNKIIFNYVKNAHLENEISFKIFENDAKDVKDILNIYKSKNDSSIINISEKVAEYKTITKLIYLLASDKVFSESTTDTFLIEYLKPTIDTILNEFKNEYHKVLIKLDYNLQKNTTHLAYNLAELNDNLDTLNFNIDTSSNLDFQNSLRNLGFDAIGISTAVIFDSYAIKNSIFIPKIWKNITNTTSKMLNRQITKVIASLSAPLVDGPLPIGDILALGGVIWTGYDIYKIRTDFKNEINISINNILGEIQTDYQKQLIDNSLKIMNYYNSIQESLGEQSREKLNEQN